VREICTPGLMRRELEIEYGRIMRHCQPKGVVNGLGLPKPLRQFSTLPLGIRSPIPVIADHLLERSDAGIQLIGKALF
jgi:hypothetical protein